MTSNRHVRPTIARSAHTRRGTIASTMRWPSVNLGLSSAFTHSILQVARTSLSSAVAVQYASAIPQPANQFLRVGRLPFIRMPAQWSLAEIQRATQMLRIHKHDQRETQPGGCGCERHVHSKFLLAFAGGGQARECIRGRMIPGEWSQNRPEGTNCACCIPAGRRSPAHLCPRIRTSSTNRFHDSADPWEKSGPGRPRGHKGRAFPPIFQRA